MRLSWTQTLLTMCRTTGFAIVSLFTSLQWNATNQGSTKLGASQPVGFRANRLNIPSGPGKYNPSFITRLGEANSITINAYNSP